MGKCDVIKVKEAPCRETGRGSEAQLNCPARVTWRNGITVVTVVTLMFQAMNINNPIGHFFSSASLSWMVQRK